MARCTYRTAFYACATGKTIDGELSTLYDIARNKGGYKMNMRLAVIAICAAITTSAMGYNLGGGYGGGGSGFPLRMDGDLNGKILYGGIISNCLLTNVSVGGISAIETSTWAAVMGRGSTNAAVELNMNNQPITNANQINGRSFRVSLGSGYITGVTNNQLQLFSEGNPSSSKIMLKPENGSGHIWMQLGASDNSRFILTDVLSTGYTHSIMSLGSSNDSYLNMFGGAVSNGVFYGNGYSITNINSSNLVAYPLQGLTATNAVWFSDYPNQGTNVDFDGTAMWTLGKYAFSGQEYPIMWFATNALVIENNRITNYATDVNYVGAGSSVKVESGDALNVYAGGVASFIANGTTDVKASNSLLRITGGEVDIFTEYDAIEFKSTNGRYTNIVIGRASGTNDAIPAWQIGQYAAVTSQVNTFTAQQNFNNLNVGGQRIIGVTYPTNNAVTNTSVLGADVFGEVTNLYWRTVSPEAYGQSGGAGFTQALTGVYTEMTNGYFTNFYGVIYTPTSLVTTVGGDYYISVGSAFDVSANAVVEAHVFTNGVEVVPEIGFVVSAGSIGFHTSHCDQLHYLPAGTTVQIKWRDADGGTYGNILFGHWHYMIRLVRAY